MPYAYLGHKHLILLLNRVLRESRIADGVTWLNATVGINLLPREIGRRVKWVLDANGVPVRPYAPGEAGGEMILTLPVDPTVIPPKKALRLKDRLESLGITVTVSNDAVPAEKDALMALLATPEWAGRQMS